ncbi:Cro/C1-type helix-turn-helix domain protein [Vibrio phage 1.187.O._10N.286.49.F1]|nr:Cro/C1-type helix-turn-helix domain protein [Vibrio phage 1.187.O._10N.286.49.F1]
MKLISVGRLLKESYLVPSGMSLNSLAKELEVSPSTLSRVLTDKSVLTVDMAIKLEKVWPRKAYTWLDHQVKYQLQEMGYDLKIYDPL